jgi:hypothetical protein
MLGDAATKLQRFGRMLLYHAPTATCKKTQASAIVVHTSTLRAAPGCITEPTCAFFIYCVVLLLTCALYNSITQTTGFANEAMLRTCENGNAGLRRAHLILPHGPAGTRSSCKEQDAGSSQPLPYSTI